MRFQKPPLGTVRKRFAWLPRKAAVYAGDLQPMKGWKLIPFTPGCLQAPGLAYPAPARGGPRATGGGMVAHPVAWQSTNEFDGWMWFEWYVEELQVRNDYNTNSTFSTWMVIGTRRQWNLWHEYD
ncbi:MAG: hypothetical protein ACLP7Q_02440 [Isosphaeraceae bacterium]